MKNFIMVIIILTSCMASAQSWETNFDNAMALAGKSGHNIILVFSGSDWCAPCIKLDKNIWQSEEFKSYAKEHWVLLKADFPRKKMNRLSEKQTELNAALADKYNKNGHFPLVVVLDPNGNVQGQTSYKKLSPSDYIALLEEFKS